MEQFPYYKVFIDSRLRLQILWYTNAERHGFKRWNASAVR